MTTATAPPAPAPAAPGPPPPRRFRAAVLGVVLAAALAAVLFGVLGSTSSKGAGGGVAVPVGGPAPDFSLPSLATGRPVRLDALGRDAHRAVVLNFFASWCTPCQEETPLLARTGRALAAAGAPVVIVGVDTIDPPGAARAFVARTGVTYPVVADATGVVTDGGYGVDGDPQTFFIDRSGTVVGHVEGPLTAPVLDRWLRRLGARV